MLTTVKTFRKTIIIFLVVITVAALAFVGIKKVGTLIYPLRYKEYIKTYSQQYDLDPLLIAAIIRTESKYHKDATSPKGAMGLMQITPSTGKWIAEQIGIEKYNTSSLYDPQTNIMMGCWYIDNLRKQFSEIRLVLAAYNGGRGNVEKWLRNIEYSFDGETLYKIPFKETKEYIERVETSYKIYKLLYDKD